MRYGLPFIPSSIKQSCANNGLLPDSLKTQIPQTQLDSAESLYQAIHDYSPYLTRLIERHPESFSAALNADFTSHFNDIIENLKHIAHTQTEAQWMQQARKIKQQAALIIALADITGEWNLEKVTHALSEFADHAVQSALQFLLLQAAKSKLWKEENTHDTPATGISILGMGKLGAHELNYSSDIDLIILFDPEKLTYTGSKSPQQFINKLTQQLTHMLETRTGDGYVLRTDLRLRPDPMSTPPAISLSAAVYYYETVGQNWERAAMIKARHVAGDTNTSMQFLQAMLPYIWRKHLDFYMITDIRSIMRQMHTTRELSETLYEHNIKTGIGGIRSIEFIAQTQQLVWGGRNADLRKIGTIGALKALSEARIITQEDCSTLETAYEYLRILEHRLQMIDDAQTHSLPGNGADMLKLSHFMGFETAESFIQKTKAVLSSVQEIYKEAMQDSTPLVTSGNLVFTGVDIDDDTLNTLAEMGYKEGARVATIIQGWHRGTRRSTRYRRARQLLTELVPIILTKLSETTDPDTAFFQFDEFLNRLPSGAQIFSLIQARPEILSFISHILGSAKALGRTLSANPLLLDAMMEPEFFMPLPNREELEQELHERTKHSADFEQTMLLMRSFHHEKRFQAGAHMLKHLASVDVTSYFLSDLADIELDIILSSVIAHYQKDNPNMPELPILVLGFGRLGARELTFGSDLDLVLLYDDNSVTSDNNADIRKHIHRIGQRFIHALTSLTRDGRLYEVDTRLRPGGSNGPLAVSFSGFEDYFNNAAWIFEFMALTKARVITHNNNAASLHAQEMIRSHIVQPRDSHMLAKSVVDMRARIRAEYPAKNIWHVKYANGGLIDIEFLAQFLVLNHAYEHPMLYQNSIASIFTQASAANIITDDVAETMIRAHQLFTTCLSYQRLCVPGGITKNTPAKSLTEMIEQALPAPPDQNLISELEQSQAKVQSIMTHFEQAGSIASG